MGPSVAPRTERQVIAAMEELVLLLARPQDIVILRRAPDSQFLAYLQEYGLARCRMLIVQHDDPTLDICELICRDPPTLAALAAHPLRNRLRFFFYGATIAADQLVQDTGIPNISASSDVTHRVNDKCFSSRLTGLPHTVPSLIANSPAALYDIATRLLQETHGKVLLKDPMGVSGRGIRMCASTAELEHYLEYLQRRSINSCTMIVETFIEKRHDLNYQFFLHPSGRVSYYLYKEALVEGCKHLGHFTPAMPDAHIEATCRHAADVIGAALASARYTGLVGVDGLVAQNGTVYPLLEINARLNNSSFQWALDQARHHGLCLLSNQVMFTLQHRPTFSEFHDRVVKALPYRTDEGLMIMNWATVSRLREIPARSRLMYAVFASTRDRCLILQQMLAQRIHTFFTSDVLSSPLCPAQG
ncbi:MAG: ATP-grasp domain-containing protein [Deltaproteobacteria bacterium]|nr:ATP-grasp domain-containing protein [Deltaproteobacteria bacterium]